MVCRSPESCTAFWRLARRSSLYSKVDRMNTAVKLPGPNGNSAARASPSPPSPYCRVRYGIPRRAPRKSSAKRSKTGMLLLNIGNPPAIRKGRALWESSGLRTFLESRPEVAGPNGEPAARAGSAPPPPRPTLHIAHQVPQQTVKSVMASLVGHLKDCRRNGRETVPLSSLGSLDFLARARADGLWKSGKLRDFLETRPEDVFVPECAACREYRGEAPQPKRHRHICCARRARCTAASSCASGRSPNPPTYCGVCHGEGHRKTAMKQSSSPTSEVYLLWPKAMRMVVVVPESGPQARDRAVRLAFPPHLSEVAYETMTPQLAFLKQAAAKTPAAKNAAVLNLAAPRFQPVQPHHSHVNGATFPAPKLSSLVIPPPLDVEGSDISIMSDELYAQLGLQLKPPFREAYFSLRPGIDSVRITCPYSGTR
ncbi:hypothetical protein BDK51DRAFT_48394 [Blyttiomyces helicus]|uniref:Uncharacterized protein n=1 Tax=Blyttiomyces helicus TaxID=388810 RepID=A0A4P9W636_9FUNG|nr:hypothetical protein BDK51DRAFT_48394 [Blyttiomyces helicus]|eukprot:RKO87909.1 hypothetical protein BDK51DRAFT_48394 [Blyttiomyces helicus]